MPMHAERDIAMANLSVCLSVTLWYCIETNANFVTLFPSPARGMILVFAKFQGKLFSGGVR